MKIRELQNDIRDLLNGIETLIQGGCKAFSEDTLDVNTTIQTQVQQSRGVAIVVVTPEFTRNGCAADGIPCDAQLLVRCIEAPALNRKRAGHLTALGAAEIVAHELGSADATERVPPAAIHFDRIGQTADERSGTVTATVTFKVAVNLS